MEGISSNKCSLIIEGKGIIHFTEKAVFSEGTSVRVDNGELFIGNNFYCNKNCFISCNSLIRIGNDVLMGWNVNIRDSDGHALIRNNKIVNNVKEIIIGNHTWLAAQTSVLKGVEISEGCVIAWGCIVTKSVLEENSLVAGIPGKIIEKNIDWKL